MSDINLISVPLLDWPYVVTSITNTPPGSPSLNDCYVVGTSPTGAWSGHASGIARWNSSSAWEFQTPSAGRTVYVTGLSAFRMWNGSTWVELPTKVPTGGTSGQVLAKNSSTDYDASWSATHYVPTGGTTGQALTKTSGTDYDASWTTIGYANGPLTVYFFASTLSISNATGAIGDLAVVGGSPQGIYYKDASNTWTLGGSITSTTTYGSVTGLTVGGSNTNGVASSAARSDHVHSLPAFGTTAGTFAQGNDSRLSDDRTASGIRTATTVVSVSSATAPTSGQVLTATSTTSAQWSTPTGTGTITGVTAGIGLTGGGTSGTVSLAVSYGTTSGTAAQGNDSRLSDDRTASGLRTATTTVAISSATAPTSGQVLTATGGSAATWQSPASGAPSGSAGGDLGGTYPNPTVTQARGLLTASTTVSVSSATAPTAGQVLTATSSTAATWQTPPGSSSTTTVKKAGTSIGTRGAINLIEGSNVTITASDDSANDKVDVTIAATSSSGGGTRNPFIAAPVSAHTLDDEFDSGSADLATRGWTVVLYGTSTTMTRTGDITLSGAPTFPTNTYRSTIVGSMLYVQTNFQLLNVFKTLPNTNSQRQQHTVRARMPGPFTLRRTYRGIISAASGAPWFATGSSFAITYIDAPTDGAYRGYLAGTTNWTGTSWSIGPSTLPAGAQPDIFWHHRKSGQFDQALINSQSGSADVAYAGITNPAGVPITADTTTVGFVVGSQQGTNSTLYSMGWAEISCIDYFRVTDATTETNASVWFD